MKTDESEIFPYNMIINASIKLWKTTPQFKLEHNCKIHQPIFNKCEMSTNGLVSILIFIYMHYCL